jgi:sulfatase-modifying factor enzyme 1
MTWVVVADPRDEGVPTASNLAHSLLIPRKGTLASGLFPRRTGAEGCCSEHRRERGCAGGDSGHRRQVHRCGRLCHRSNGGDDRGLCALRGRKKCSPAASDDIACNWPKRKAKGEHPINCVTVEQAEAYCAYESARLPTVAEWQLAAGGPEKRPYPWGSTHPSNIQVTEPPAGGAYGPGAARHYLCWSGDGTDREKYPTWTCPVGSFPAGNTPSGISDLAGNVAEWTSTTVKLPHGPVHHVIKGGGYNFDGLGRLEVAVEDSETHGSGHQAPDVGFRCVTGTKAEAQP